MYKRFCQFVFFFSFILLAINSYAENIAVEIKTSLGNFTVELYPEKAPKTVENFLQYVDEVFYGKDQVFPPHVCIAFFQILWCKEEDLMLI